MISLINKSTNNYLFYNSRLVTVKHPLLLNYKEKISRNERIAELSLRIGDFFLRPVRYLYNGNKITITKVATSDNFTPNVKHLVDSVTHEKEYTISLNTKWERRKHFWRTAAAITFFFPGLILGTLFKKFSYRSTQIQHKLELAIEHFSANPKQIGDEDSRRDLTMIARVLSNMKKNDPLNRPIPSLVIYAKKGTLVTFEPKLLLQLNPPPQKIIFDGAKIINSGKYGTELHSALLKDPCWVREKDKQAIYQAKSVQVALDEILPADRRKMYVV